MQLGFDVKDPSTLSGGIGLVGGVAGILSYILPGSLSHLVGPLSLIITTLAGLAFTLTKNYSGTASKTDDVIHDIAGMVVGQKDPAGVAPAQS